MKSGSSAPIWFKALGVLLLGCAAIIGIISLFISCIEIWLDSDPFEAADYRSLTVDLLIVVA